MSALNKFVYAGLVSAQLCTFSAYVVMTAGAALLQQKANTLTLFDGLTGTNLTDTQAVYNDVFQSTTYIIPYPQRPQYQFQYQWWVIEFEFFCFAITAAITLFPRAIHRCRPVALTFIASALVLVMDNINALYFLLRSDLAKTVFDEYRIETAQAGLIMVGVSNFLTIIFLGLYQDDHVVATHAPDGNIQISNAPGAKHTSAV